MLLSCEALGFFFVHLLTSLPTGWLFSGERHLEKILYYVHTVFFCILSGAKPHIYHPLTSVLKALEQILMSPTERQVTFASSQTDVFLPKCLWDFSVPQKPSWLSSWVWFWQNIWTSKKWQRKKEHYCKVILQRASAPPH